MARRRSGGRQRGFEALTAALGEKAWALFQDLEREGGIVAASRPGRSRPTSPRRDRARAGGRDAARADHGHERVPNLSEAEVKVLLPRLSHGAETESAQRTGRRDRCAPSPRSASPRPTSTCATRPTRCPRDRLASEDISRRSRTPAALRPGRGSPGILFEAGGIEAVTNEGFADPAALAEGFRAFGAKAACLCSSDAILYAEPCGRRGSRLKGAGCARVSSPGAPARSKRSFAKPASMISSRRRRCVGFLPKLLRRRPKIMLCESRERPENNMPS